MKSYVDILPKFLTRRFLAPDGRSELIAGRIPDKDASELLPVVNKLDRGLDGVRAAHPGYQSSTSPASPSSPRATAPA